MILGGFSDGLTEKDKLLGPTVGLRAKRVHGNGWATFWTLWPFLPSTGVGKERFQSNVRLLYRPR